MRASSFVFLALTSACTNRVTPGSGGSTGTTTSSASTTASSSATTMPVTVASSTSATQASASASTGQGGAGACTPPDGAILAINHIYFGDKDPNGTSSTTAWMQYGANIDGQNSMPPYPNHCTPNSGGMPQQTEFENGNNGIDNSFGHNIVPMLETLQQNFSDNINATITMGDTGYFFDLVGLMAMPDQTNVTTRFYSGDSLGHPPAFDGTDCWPVDGATVNNTADITSAKVLFTGGSLASNVWTSGPPQTLRLTITFQGNALLLTLHHAVVTAPLTVDHRSTVLGEISGVLNTEEFVNGVKQFAGALAPSLCGSATLTSIENQMRQASDIMTSGTQDPTMVCDGISVGLGFTAKPIQLGGVGPASAPPPMPCP